MKNFASAAFGCCLLLAILSCAGEVRGAIWEIHPGLYASYLYTDNYNGTVEDKEDEDIYAVGPSLAISCTTEKIRWGLVGHIAKNFHRNYDEDDKTEGDVATHALVTGLNQSLDLSYAYRETRERETLDQALGVRRIHNGALTYNRTLTAALSASLGYNRNMEYAPRPDQDVISDGGTIGLHYQVTPRNLFDITTSYEAYRYEDLQVDSDEVVLEAGNNQDVQVLSAETRWMYLVSQSLRMGPNLIFERHTFDEPSDQTAELTDYTDLDIYTAALLIDYLFSPATVMNASIGGSWLKSEEDKDQYLTNGRCSLSHTAQKNTILADFFYGFAYEYDSQNDLGIYETTTFNASWEHFFTPKVLSTLEYGITRKIPVESDIATIEGEETRDIVYRAGLIYRSAGGAGFGSISETILPREAQRSETTEAPQPSQAQTAPLGGTRTPSPFEPRAGGPPITHWQRGAFEVRGLYERLENEYEHLDSVVENRYSLSIEVRY